MQRVSRRRRLAREGNDSFARVVGTERDPQRRHPCRSPELAGDLREDVGRGGPGCERAADREELAGLALAGLGLERPRTLQGRELANDQPHEEQQHEIQPLARVADRERVDRVDEEKVVQEDSGHRRGQGADGPGHERGHDDREQVDGRGVQDAEAILQQPDERGRGGERRHGDQEEARGATAAHERPDSITPS